jgi:signal transduction histidine kinase
MAIGTRSTRSTSDRRARRPAYAYLAVGSILAASYYVLPDPTNEAMYDLIALSSAVAIVVGIVRYRPVPVLPWWLLAAGMLAWFAGDMAWDWYPVITGRDLAAPSPADALYLLAYPLLIAAVALVVRTRGAALRRGGWIDAAIVAVVFLTLVWEYGLEDHLSGGLTLAEGVKVAYPLMDALLLGLLARLLFAPGPRTLAYVLLVASMSATLASDTAFTQISAIGSWSAEHALAAGWLVGYLMIGAAALHPSMVTVAGDADRPEHPLSRRRAVMIAVLTALPILLFVLTEGSAGNHGSHVASAVAVLVVLGMVFYRLSSLIGSIDRQATELGRLHRDRGFVLDEITRAIEEERTRLAAELHDGPIQRVTGLGMRAYVGLRKLRAGDQAAAAKTLQEIESGLNREVHSLRALMTQLRPPVLSERGLTDALRDHADTISSEHGIATLVEGSIDQRLSPEVETGLYRIAQEALMNACRHSGARRIEIRLETMDHVVRLSVRDDGEGFDAQERVERNGGQHFGLLAMRERASMLGGTLQIISSPGHGTSVIAGVPLEASP